MGFSAEPLDKGCGKHREKPSHHGCKLPIFCAGQAGPKQETLHRATVSRENVQ